MILICCLVKVTDCIFDLILINTILSAQIHNVMGWQIPIPVRAGFNKALVDIS